MALHPRSRAPRSLRSRERRFQREKKKENNGCVQVKFDVVNKATNCVVPLEKEYDHFVSPGAGESEYTSESNSS